MELIGLQVTKKCAKKEIPQHSNLRRHGWQSYFYLTNMAFPDLH